MKNIFKISLFGVLMLASGVASAQVAIGTDTPSDAAALDISSQIDGAGPYKGLMPPRVPLETDRDAILTTPTDSGLLVFVEATGCLDIFNGSFWEHIKCNTAVPFAPPSDNEQDSIKSSEPIKDGKN